jgi:hypothetical protein
MLIVAMHLNQTFFLSVVSSNAETYVVNKILEHAYAAVPSIDLIGCQGKGSYVNR